jgi:hypothetical protein
MRHALALAAAVIIALTLSVTAFAGHPGDSDVQTLAVFGDAPYGVNPTDLAQLAASPAFIDSVNADPNVSLVIHLGDIHSGKQWCTEAYDRTIVDLWTRFVDPLVFTPGDNEWSDCHKKGQGGNVLDANGTPVDYANGNPVANLALVRSLFFPQTGWTLGQHPQRVLSQGDFVDTRHPADAHYVENVMWVQAQTLFVTVNVPGGSNNDTDPWYGAAAMTPEQSQEVTDRTAADIRWLGAAFLAASAGHLRGVVVVDQANMWDLDGVTAAHLTQYEPIVSALAAGATRFARPVLLLEGDSHLYRSDNPLSATAPCTAEFTPCPSERPQHPFYDVPNVHRVVVHGSTTPLEWLRLTVDPHANVPAGANAFGPFSWERIQP